MQNKTEVAIFGGGCFWCTEAGVEQRAGVVTIMPGYAGGKTENPTYEQVCSGSTGHAEVIKVEFDRVQTSYDDLLTVFFATHDPTTRNRQGNDVGTQYRSIILYANEDQKRAAEKFIRTLNESGKRVVTELEAWQEFYPAEEYHRRYYQNNASAPYCQILINPKLAKLKDRFDQLLKASKIK